MLTTKNLGVRYGDAIAVADINLTVDSGEFVAIVGSNGAGKSSVGTAIAGLTPSTGEVEFGGSSLKGVSAEERVRRGIVYVPEGRRVFTQATVQDNLKAGAFVRRRSHDWRTRLGEVYERLPRLEERAGVKAELLSGGEQQLLAIGRGLMARPTLMILDEPSLGLSPRAIDTVVRFLSEVAAAEDLSVLILEQNISFASRVAQRAAVMSLGRIRGELGPAEIAQPQLVLKMLTETEGDSREKS